MSTLACRLRHVRPSVHHLALRAVHERLPLLAKSALAGDRRGLRAAVALVSAGSVCPDPARLRVSARVLAARCARDLVPFTDLTEACEITATTLVTQVWARCGPGEASDAHHLTARIVVAHRQALRALAAGYHAASWLKMRALADYRAAAADLAVGRTPAGMREPDGGYLVAALRPKNVPAREELVWLVEHSRGDKPMLVRVDERHGMVVLVLPLHDPTRAGRRRGERALRSLVGEVVELMAVPAAGCAYTRFARGMPAAVRAAHGALPRSSASAELVIPAGELLLEQAYDNAPELTELIRNKLLRLRGEPELLRTLSVLLAHDLDRGQTAAALHVHRATLTYRLRRIQELTGTNPTSVVGIRLFSAALSVAAEGDHRR